MEIFILSQTGDVKPIIKVSKLSSGTTRETFVLLVKWKSSVNGILWITSEKGEDLILR